MNTAQVGGMIHRAMELGIEEGYAQALHDVARLFVNQTYQDGPQPSPEMIVELLRQQLGGMT